MKVFVTGGAGYIGSHTVKQLLQEGFEVVVFDNFSSGKRELVPGGEIIQGDLLDKPSVEKALRKTKIQAVFHFASLIQVGESYVNPHRYYAHNLISTLNLMDAVIKEKIPFFIFSSSAAVYGIPEQIPIPESHPQNPINPYGQTKYFIEKILHDYDRAYGLRSISLRYFNAAGADPDGNRGEIHDPETHLIPNILLFLLGKKDSFNIFGTDFPTPDGTAIRDYIHVTDLARAHVMALQKLIAQPQSEYINLGIGKGFSVLDIIQKIEGVTGKKVHYGTKPRRKGDVPVLMASKDKAEDLLGWIPQYSKLETIIQTAWNWHSK